jgi:glycosyltransferase involved in cell wall biosynthesis
MPQQNTPEPIEAASRAVKTLSVLLVVPWDQEGGGVASVVGYVARHLSAHGHRVLFLHPGPTEFLRYRRTKWGFEGALLNLRSPFLPEHPIRSIVAFVVTFPFTLFEVVRMLRKHHIDVVNIHFAGPAFVCFAFCRWLLPIKLVISVHGTDVAPFSEGEDRSSPALRTLLKAADLIVGPSWAFLRKCNELLTSLSARQIVIHNGIDLRELDPPAAAPESRGEERDFILSVASHDEWKGLDILIRAMALLKEQGQTRRLVLAGDGPLRSKLEELTAALGLGKQIEFIGFQSRSSVARLLNDCTLFVLPSRYESFGIAIVEALACGKPVVATAVDGIPEIIEHDRNGILVEPGDAPALAAAIQRVLGDAELRERLGRSGRLRVEDRFQWQLMGERYTHAYAELVERA